MEKAFFIQLISYAPLLKLERINFKEDEKTLTVGIIQATADLVIFISCRTIDTPDMLNKVLPVLKKSQCSYRLIKNQSLQYRLNSGYYGDDEAGKVVSIFTKTVDDVAALLPILNEITTHYKGPLITNSQRVSKNLYIQSATNDNGVIKLTKPDIKSIPYCIPKEYLKKKKENAIIGTFFLPVQNLRASAKGNIYKGINLKNFAFSWCTIKQGNPVALDDHFDRDMKDRLLWQKEVIERLSSVIYTPKVIDYFEKEGSCYLLLDFAEGDSFGHIIKDAISGKIWKELPMTQRKQFLDYYLQILDLVENIHQYEFVHRDITDTNFLVMADDSVCIIDFELAYSLSDKRPDPPFLLGTMGYAAPEQLQYAMPDKKEDIYALGALLSFTISGCPPHEFLNTNAQAIRAKIHRLSGSTELAAIVVKCLHINRKDRPNIPQIKGVLTKYIETLKPEFYEKIPMAI